MLAWLEVFALVAAVMFAFYAERQAMDARDAAHRAGLQAARARQAADAAERAAYGMVRRAD